MAKVSLVHKVRVLHVPFGDDVARIMVRHWHPKKQGGPRKLLIAVHGLTGTGLDYRYLVLKLAAAGWHVVAPDLPGHGKSTQFGHSNAYVLGDMIRALRKLCKAFGADDGEACFIGSSMGSGLVAALLAAFEMKAKAVILNDNALGFDPNLLRYVASMRAEPATFATREDAESQLMARNRDLYAQGDDHEIDPAAMQHYLQSRIIASDDGFRYNFDRTLIERDAMTASNYPDFMEIIRRIRAQRIMLMFGEYSPFRISPVLDRIREAYPDIVHCIVEGAGHAPRLMTPTQVEIVRTFLELQPTDRPARA